MSLQSLREQALARTRTALLRRQVVLDEALDKAATEARQHATDARNRVVLHEVEQDRMSRADGTATPPRVVPAWRRWRLPLWTLSRLPRMPNGMPPPPPCIWSSAGSPPTNTSR